MSQHPLDIGASTARRGLLRPPHRGFTLIELLVVVAIIAILVSILMPSLSKSRELAKRTGCSIQQRDIYLASIMFANDHDSYLPGVGENPAGRWVVWPTNPVEPFEFEARKLSIERLWKAETVSGRPNDEGLGYLNGRELMRCPSREDRLKPNDPLSGGFNEWDLYIKYRRWNYFDSSYNYTGGSAEWIAACNGGCGKSHLGLHATSIDKQEPSQTLLMDMLVKKNPANIYYSGLTQSNHVSDGKAAGANATRVDGSTQWLSWGSTWPWADGRDYDERWYRQIYNASMLPRGSYFASYATPHLESAPGGARAYFFKRSYNNPLRGKVIKPPCLTGYDSNPPG